MTRKHRFHICSHDHIWALLRKCSRKHSKPLLNTSECFSSSFYDEICNVPYMVKRLIPFKRLLLIIRFYSYSVHKITRKSQILPPPLLPQKNICNFADLYANSVYVRFSARLLALEPNLVCIVTVLRIEGSHDQCKHSHLNKCLASFKCHDAEGVVVL